MIPLGTVGSYLHLKHLHFADLYCNGVVNGYRTVPIYTIQ